MPARPARPAHPEDDQDPLALTDVDGARQRPGAGTESHGPASPVEDVPEPETDNTDDEEQPDDGYVSL